jgi:hypothetical protein
MHYSTPFGARLALGTTKFVTELNE